MTVILLNCLTLGLYKPCVDEVCATVMMTVMTMTMQWNCVDEVCATVRCRVLQVSDHLIFVFFTVEMLVKMTAMGVIGKKAYLAETWNRLDMFIVLAGLVAFLFIKTEEIVFRNSFRCLALLVSAFNVRKANTK